MKLCILTVFSVLSIAAVAVGGGFEAYDSSDFIPGVTATPTGFFQVKKTDGGRWHVFDPKGRAVYLRAVGHVRYRGVYCYRKGKPYGYYHQWNDAHYPNREAWCKETAARLKAWGFNMLGGGTEGDEMKNRGFIYARSLLLSHGLTVGKDKQGLFICPHEGSPCTAFPDVFHPDFEAYCDSFAKKNCADLKDDPWMLGYFIDNELSWWGRGGSATGLFDCAVRLSPESHARQAAERFAAQHGMKAGQPVPDEVKHGFLKLAAERYFSITTAAIRRHDPNHMILGARFAGLHGADPVVWEISGKYCDMITFNCYPWADLDRNVMMTRRGSNGVRLVDAFNRQYAYGNKPFFITEWSFMGMDSGLPCTTGAGQRFLTQRERAQAASLMARTLMAMPSVVGYIYFMWVDDPPEGISRWFPEDSNYGLVNEKGVPYRELTEMFTKLHADIPKHLSASIPEERPAPPPSFSTAEEFSAEHKMKPSEMFERNGDSWRWSNGAGMVLEGGLGKGRIIRKVMLKGDELGEFNAMGQYVDEGGSKWQELESVTDIQYRDGGLIVTAMRNGDNGKKFEFRLRIVLDDRRPEFLVELLDARNIGQVPITFKGFFLCQYSPFMREKASAQIPPTVWKCSDATAWRADDGRVFGAMTKAPDVKFFRYFTTVKSIHPDAAFAPADLPEILQPGGRYNCQGHVWMLCNGAPSRK